MASQPTSTPAAPDVQASRAGDAGQPLAGRRDRGREGDPGQGRRRREPLLRRVRVLRRPQPAAGRRPHVPLRGDRRRGDRRGRAGRGLQGRGAGRPRRREGARAPGRAAGRGLGHRPLPGDGHDPGERQEHPGDLRPLRHRGRLRAGHPDADRGPGPGHDRLPLRPGDGRRALARTARRRGLRAPRRSSASSTSSRSPPTTSAASAPSTSAAPRAARPGSTRRSCCGSSRAR